MAAFPPGINGPNPAEEIRRRKLAAQKHGMSLPPPPPVINSQGVQASTPPVEAAPQHGKILDPRTGQPMATPQMGAPKTEVPALTLPPYQQPQYPPPKKGLEYLALGVGLLFPGAPIARMAAGFAGGLQQGAQNAYERQTQQAEQQYKVQSAAAQADFQNRLAKRNAEMDDLKRVAGNDEVAFKVGTDALNRKYGDAVAVAAQHQDLAAQGTDWRTGKPFILPPQLEKPPDAKLGDAGLAEWHQKRALYYTNLRATGPAAQETSAAKEANQRAIDAANNARQLFIADQRLKTQVQIHNDSERHADDRHYDSEAHADARHMDSEIRADRRADVQLGGLKVRAMDANKAFLVAYDKATKAPTKTVEVKDQNGVVTGTHEVPAMEEIKDQNGVVIKSNPRAAAIAGPMQQQLVKLFGNIGRSADPSGAAQYYADHMDHTPSGVAASELLYARGAAAELQRLSEGRRVIPGDFPKIEASKNARGATGLDGDIKQMVDAGADPRKDSGARAALVLKYGEAAVAAKLTKPQPMQGGDMLPRIQLPSLPSIPPAQFGPGT